VAAVLGVLSMTSKTAKGPEHDFQNCSYPRPRQKPLKTKDKKLCLNGV